MFDNASNFSQYLNNWDLSSLNETTNMFLGSKNADLYGGTPEVVDNEFKIKANDSSINDLVNE